MRYLSVCSGIEAATVAWHPLGWEAAAYSEIEKFPSQVLAHHYPEVPNVGDMTKFKEWSIGPIDLLVGGTPCQSFSVAGLRKGLDDPRGNLMLTYLAIADQYRPRWLVWENVPGVLSSNGGKDFGVFLGALGELGYGFAYRILDAQYFGVAQRRRRVFVVGYLGDWRVAAAVLFERHSLSGDSAPSRKKGEGVAASIGAGVDASGIQQTVGTLCADAHPGAYSGQDAYTGRLVPSVVGTLTAKGVPAMGAPEVDANHYFPAIAQPKIIHGTQDPCVSDVAFAQGRNNGGENVLIKSVGTDLYNGAITGDVAATMSTHGSDASGTGPTVMQAMAVRRLTPVECERLQGFPDSYTDIKPNNKATPDGPRYKALGNSMAVPVMAWIGKRIQMVENL